MQTVAGRVREPGGKAKWRPPTSSIHTWVLGSLRLLACLLVPGGAYLAPSPHLKVARPPSWASPLCLARVSVPLATHATLHSTGLAHPLPPAQLAALSWASLSILCASLQAALQNRRLNEIHTLESHVRGEGMDRAVSSEEIKADREEVTCPRSHSKFMANSQAD